METKLSRWCDGLIEVGWLFVVIAVPLFFNIHSDRVFEPDKLTLMRSIAVVMGAAWLVKFVDLRQWQQASRLRWRADDSFWRMPFLLIVTLLALVYIISSIFSVTPHVSWAGSYQRLQGTYTTLSYIVIFGTTIATIRTRAQVRRLVTAVIITSIPIAFYGLLQHFDLDPLPWAGDVTARVAGHMGNAIFIAAYLIMAVPLTVARIIASFSSILSDEELSSADVMRSSAYIFAVAIQLIAIYWSGSRGPWLGLGVGLFAFILVVLVGLRNASESQGRFRLQEAGVGALFVLAGTAVSYTIVLLILRGITGAGYLASLAGPMSSFVAFVAAVGLVIVGMFVLVAAQRGWRWLWFSWIVMSLLLAVWLVLFNLPSQTSERYMEMPLVGNIFNTLNEWRDLPRIGRLGEVLEADTGTGRVRTLIWEGVLQLIQPHEPINFPDGSTDTFNFLRPLIGYGPESMYVAYNGFYPPELATLEARNASPDRSHNETFDALVITGLLGFLVWQALYLSVFLYGFRWLGVLRTKFERNLLIGLWIGVGVITAVAFTIWRGAVYIGVALPFGSIAGLVLYLIYYALFADSSEGGDQPFAAERLLVVALVAAILAHFVEIHFGIAISASRLHFFLYVGLLFIITYWLPQQQGTAVTETDEEEAPVVSKRKRRRAARTRPAIFSGWVGPVLLYGFMLALILGIIGFTYTTYAQPPDLVLESVNDLTAVDILHQSFFLNIKRNFTESPFIYLMAVLTWSLGLLIAVSEMLKDGDLRVTAVTREINKSQRTIVSASFLVMGAVSILYRLVIPLPADASATALLGQTLLWMWGALCLWAGGNLQFRFTKNDRLFAAGVAVTGMLFTLPLMLGGGFLPGLLVLIFSGAMLYLLWDPNWRNLLTPVAIMAGVSFVIGLLYAYYQANLYRFSLLYRAYVPPPETVDRLFDYLVEEAAQAAGFLTYFYIFVIGLMLLAALVVSMSKKPRLRNNGSTPGYALLGLLGVTAVFLILTTNLRVVQADIVYKRGVFFDNEAANTGDPTTWESAIAIYQDAINRAPNEDFYYLFLGRAYLELSNATSDLAEQQQLLAEAEQQLFTAQDINPLNTDHTANLARLNTRWASVSTDETERAQHLVDAEQYYQSALTLSPQNSVIRNEYARLVLSQGDNCRAGLDIYKQSATIDPYYPDTFFAWADAAAGCAGDAEGATAQAFYEEAALALTEGLALQPNNAQAWARAGQLYQRMEQYEAAIDAYDQALLVDPEQTVVPAWNVKYLQAQIYREMGNLAQAEALATEALQIGPPEYQGELELFIQQLQPESTAPTSLEMERPLANIPLPERNNYYSEYPDIIIDQSKNYEAVIQTEKGEMRLRLFPQASPLAVNSFVFLAQQGYYDGTTFHRVIADFVAQGGDPTGTGGGEPGYRFTDEVDNGLTFDRPGLLAMANAGANTNGGQFFITYAPLPALNGRHTIFGELIAGEDVLQSLTLRDPEQSPDFEGDQILRIDIIEVDE